MAYQFSDADRQWYSTLVQKVIKEREKAEDIHRGTERMNKFAAEFLEACFITQGALKNAIESSERGKDCFREVSALIDAFHASWRKYINAWGVSDAVECIRPLDEQSSLNDLETELKAALKEVRAAKKYLEKKPLAR